MPATEMSPHGRQMAPARIQPASIRALGVRRGSRTGLHGLQISLRFVQPSSIL